MVRVRRLHPLWGLFFILVVLAGWVLLGQRSVIELYRERLEGSRLQIEAQQSQMDALRAEIEGLHQRLEATREQLGEYEAYFERIRPIASRLNPSLSGDVWAVAAQIDQSSRRHGVDPMLVLAVGQVESGWDLQAVGRLGEVGPMQVMPSTFRALGGRHLWDWRENIDAGTRYLAVMLDRAGGDVRLAVAYYNAGPSRPAGTVQRITARHVEKVMRVRASL